MVFRIKGGHVLFRDGDTGNFFYIIKEGLMELKLITGDTKIMKKGDTFGELALIQKNKRSGTVKCTETAVIFCLDGSVFRDVIQKINSVQLKERLFFLSLIPIFSK